MTLPPATPDKRVSLQFVYAAFAEGLLLVGVVLFFMIEPQTVLTVVLAAVAFAVGLVAAVFAIYKAVPLMAEPQTRTIGYLTIAIIVGGPLLVFAISQFI
ncbi:hypothetical protein BH10ACT7_BH10ACT7_04860 [soil metagenome]